MSMYTDLKGKTVVITGASSGLGAAMAKRFGAEGMNVVINHLKPNDEAVAPLIKTIQEAGGHAVGQQADVSKPEDNERLLQAALDNFGTVDLWINNAGLEIQQSTHEVTLEDWHKVTSVALDGVFLGAKTVLKYWMDHDKIGNIINISSVHEIIPWPTFASYAAAKGGVGILNKTMAMEYAPYGIRINNINPGAINTPINAEKFSDPVVKAEVAGMIPMGTIGEPEDVANAAAFLASDQAKYMTGVSLYVDGGMVLYNNFQAGKG